MFLYWFRLLLVQFRRFAEVLGKSRNTRCPSLCLRQRCYRNTNVEANADHALALHFPCSYVYVAIFFFFAFLLDFQKSVRYTFAPTADSIKNNVCTSSLQSGLLFILVFAIACTSKSPARILQV